MSFTISPNALVGLLEQYKGKTFASFKTRTIPDLNKKGRKSGLTLIEKFGVMPDSVYKLARFNAGIGYEYAELVMNRIVKTGQPWVYMPGTTWHEPYKGSTVIRQYKGDPTRLYVFLSLIANNPRWQEYHGVNILGDDVILDPEALAEYLPNPPKKNYGGSWQHPVKVETYKLESITEMVAEGATFVIQPEPIQVKVYA